MEKITLQPGEWKRIYPILGFQNKSNQSGIRLHVNFTGQSSQSVAPSVDTQVYFGIAEFENRVVWLRDLTNIASANYYVMPDEAMPVDIVVL